MTDNKILVVDDEEVIRELLKKIFVQAGYNIYLAESADRALEILKNESIMVMFLDLDLAGMNGIELCRKLRKDNYIGIIYALTGYTDLFSLMDCRMVGFDDFSAKPESVELLQEAVRDGFTKLERWKVSDHDLD